jgi:hypothetical protein
MSSNCTHTGRKSQATVFSKSPLPLWLPANSVKRVNKGKTSILPKDLKKLNRTLHVEVSRVICDTLSGTELLGHGGTPW